MIASISFGNILLEESHTILKKYDTEFYMHLKFNLKEKNKFFKNYIPLLFLGGGQGGGCWGRNYK